MAENDIIYIVEDDEAIRELLRCTLEVFSYEVATFERAEEMLEVCMTKVPKLILLDIMLPGMDGITALKQLRATPVTKNVRIIMLTAKGSEIDKVTGLDGGADDYMTKPFGILELTARIRAVLRRDGNATEEEESTLMMQDIVMDMDKHEVIVADNTVALTVKEFELLKVLMENSNKVVTREKLLSTVWGYDYEGESRTLDMHIKTLRNKLGDDADNPKYIKTIRGVGYMML